jgi:hypothetical protein
VGEWKVRSRRLNQPRRVRAIWYSVADRISCIYLRQIRSGVEIECS